MRLKTESLGEDVLCAVIEGDFDFAAALEMYVRVLDESWRRGRPRILLDCRGLTGTLSDMQRYEFGVAVAAAHAHARAQAGQPPRLALLGSAPLVDPRRFGETVARNRGALVRTCESTAEAAAWLGVDPDLFGRGIAPVAP